MRFSSKKLLVMVKNIIHSYKKCTTIFHLTHGFTTLDLMQDVLHFSKSKRLKDKSVGQMVPSL